MATSTEIALKQSTNNQTLLAMAEQGRVGDQRGQEALQETDGQMAGT